MTYGLHRTEGICSRCGELGYYCSVKRKLCHSCIVKIGGHKKRVEGRITEEQREKANDYSKKYYKENKHRFKQYMRKRYKNNKERWKLMNFTILNRKRLLKELGDKCIKCGSTKNIEFHHKEYPSPPYTIELLLEICVPYCRKCHRKSHRLFIVKYSPYQRDYEQY